MYNTVGLGHWLQSGFEEFLKLVQDLEEKQTKKTGIVTRISHDITSVITAKKCVFMAGFALVYNNKNKTDKRYKPKNCILLKQKCVFCD